MKAAASLALRLAALLPIPLILGAVLWASHRPVPSLSLAPKAATPAAVSESSGPKMVALPAKLQGQWTLQGQVEPFNEKTLFDRINGAAPVFLKAGFVYSLGAEYRRPGDQEPVVIDVYYMGGVAKALGIYASERDRSYRFISVGGEGYLASGSLNFWQGEFYLKLAGFDEGEAMDRALQELAQGLAEALPKNKLPGPALAALEVLPAEGRLPHSNGYSHPPLANVDGLEQVFYADYQQGQLQFRLFMVLCAEPSAAARRAARVKSFFEKDGAKITQTAQDPFQILVARGEETAALVVQTRGLLAGAVELPNPQLIETARTKLMTAMNRHVARQDPQP